MAKLTAVILAAGKGTRMKSKLPKVLHKVGGHPMLEHVMDTAEMAGCQDNVVIIGHGAELVRELAGKRARIALQAEQLGTGHAVLQAKEALKDFTGTVMILCGDTPLIEGDELKKLYDYHIQFGAAATVMTAMMVNPFGYGRILRNEKGDVTGIVEEKEATPEEKLIKEINTGNYCVEAPLLFDVLQSLGRKNEQSEYYLTNLLALLRARGEKVAGLITPDSEMSMGVNSRRQLAEAENIMRRRILDKLMDDGVTIMDPASTFIEKSVKIAPDTVICPFTWLQGNTDIGTNCEIGPNVRLVNVIVEDGCKIQFSCAHDCKMKAQK